MRSLQGVLLIWLVAAVVLFLNLSHKALHPTLHDELVTALLSILVAGVFAFGIWFRYVRDK